MAICKKKIFTNIFIIILYTSPIIINNFLKYLEFQSYTKIPIHNILNKIHNYNNLIRCEEHIFKNDNFFNYIFNKQKIIVMTNIELYYYEIIYMIKYSKCGKYYLLLEQYSKLNNDHKYILIHSYISELN